METKVALTNQSEIPFPHICYNICNIYLYIYASKTLSATKLNPEKNTSSKTNNRKGAATFYATRIWNRLPWNDQGQQSRRSPKSRHLRRFFLVTGGWGMGIIWIYPPPRMPVTTRWQNIFRLGNPKKTFICDWHPGWGVDQRYHLDGGWTNPLGKHMIVKLDLVRKFLVGKSKQYWKTPPTKSCISISSIHLHGYPWVYTP